MSTDFITALDIINNISPSERKFVGDIMLESGIFSSNEFVYVHGNAVILYHCDGQKAANESWRKIISFIALIKKLEEEKIIFLHSGSYEDWVYGKGLTKFEPGQNAGEYILADNVKLINRDGRFTIKRNETKFSEFTIDSEISKELCKYIVCTVYPGMDYSEYKSRGYITPSQYSLNLSKKANAWAGWALGIAILSFILSPFISNWFGYSTIKESQFNQLLDSISSKKTKTLSTETAISSHSLEKNDSSSSKLKKNNYDVLREKQKR